MNAAIREARLRAGLAQSQVAELIGPGVSTQAVSAWERGASYPTSRNAIALIQVLPGLTLEAIYEGQGPAANDGAPAAPVAQEPAEPAPIFTLVDEPAHLASGGWFQRLLRRFGAA